MAAINPPAAGPPSSAPSTGGAAPAPPPPSTASPSSTRTFTLQGGTAQLTCTSGQITLDWATPNSGYWVETSTEEGGAMIEVRFRSDTHESRLDAMCGGSTVVGTVQEKSS